VLKVKKNHLWIGLAAGLLATSLLTGAAWAQPAAPSRAGEVALVDIAYIFKNHPRFKAAMADLQADLTAAEEKIKKGQDELRSLVEMQKKFQSGSEQYQQYDTQIVRLKSELSVTVDMQRKKLLKDEARIYHITYKEIEQLVGSIATNRGYSVVIKVDSADADPENPQTVISSLNRNVVWAARGIDITPLVMELITRNDHAADQRGAPSRPALPQFRE
jgi:Skp family chaperone for outer membrane proteins